MSSQDTIEQEIKNGLLLGKMHGVTYKRNDETELYVSIPPACLITDTTGALWTFGFEQLIWKGEFAFSVMRNDISTGEYATRIEYRRDRYLGRNVVRILGQTGWKTWSSKNGFL